MYMFVFTEKISYTKAIINRAFFSPQGRHMTGVKNLRRFLDAMREHNKVNTIYYRRDFYEISK